jgi:hypothetical protein
VAEQSEQGGRPVLDAGKIAVEVAADAALTRRGRALTSDQLDVLEAAARFAGHSVRELDRAVRGVGSCSGEDTEQFYPTYTADPARGGRLLEERLLARRLCEGCPVQAQCLALDYAAASVYGAERHTGVEQVWGIRAGLGARDRRALMPLWAELDRRLNATAVADVAESAEGGPVAAANEVDATEAARLAVAG